MHQRTVDAEDRIWATVENVVESALVTSDDGGMTWPESLELQSPDGALTGAVVRSGDGHTLVAGITSSGAIYVHSPEVNSQ